MCNKLGGVWIYCTGGEGKINPLQVRLRPVEKEDEENSSFQSPLALYIQTLRTFFSLYLRDLTDTEKAALEDASVEVYKAAGITWGTDPKDIPNEKWSTVKELYKHLVKKAEENPEAYGRLAVLLKRAAEGADSYLWAGPTAVNADSDFIVF
jgi:hypothetical protein